MTAEPTTAAGRRALDDWGTAKTNGIVAIEQEAAAAERERIRELILAASTLILPTGVYIDREALLDDLDPETP